jgi:hypothetical protein
MSGDDRKNKIKKILEETGRVLGGGAGEGRVVVLRFPISTS